MKKYVTFLFLLVAITLTISLSSCVEIDKGIHVNPPPDTTAYVPDPLNIEFFDETPYTKMSPFQKYPTQNIVTTETSTSQSPSTEEEPEAPDTEVTP